MSAFKAWASAALFSNIGAVIALGYQFPKQPYCQTHCYMNALSNFQESTGSLTLASIFFFMAFMSFIFFLSRG